MGQDRDVLPLQPSSSRLRLAIGICTRTSPYIARADELRSDKNTSLSRINPVHLLKQPNDLSTTPLKQHDTQSNCDRLGAHQNDFTQ